MFTLDERMKSLGWRDFPFRIDVIPDVFAAPKRILGPLLVQLRTGNIVLIEGGRGTGKTHVLRWLAQYLDQSDDMIPCSISEPLTTELLGLALTNVLVKNLGEKAPTVPVLLDQLIQRLQRLHRERNQRIVLLLDEGEDIALRENDPENIEAEKRRTVRWLRVLSDLPAIAVFIAGLTGFSKALTNIFPPFVNRVTLKFNLEQPGRDGPEVLTRNETESLIRQRIEYFGGKDLAPFTQEAIDMIHLHTHGFPRATLRFCENILSMAFQEDTPAGDRVTPDFVHQVIQQHPSPPPQSTLIPLPSDGSKFVESIAELEGDEWFGEFDEFSAIQRDILSLVKAKKKATSALVAEELGIAKGTASNELKKLFDMHKLQRRKGYRGFEYLPN